LTHLYSLADLQILMTYSDLKVIWCHVVYMTVLKMLKIMQAMQMITVISE